MGDIPLRISVRAARSFSWSSFGRPGCPLLRAGGRHAVAGSLGDQARFELHDGAIPWSHIGITGDYLWKEIDHPLERFRSLRANHFNSKGFAFL